MSASPQHIQLIRNSSNTATVTAGGGTGLFTFGTNTPSIVSVGMFHLRHFDWGKFFFGCFFGISVGEVLLSVHFFLFLHAVKTPQNRFGQASRTLV
jgi:hypothetical protein